MKKSVLPSLEKFMSNGGRKIDQWFDFLSANTVIFENEKVFTNVNTPEELATLEKEFQTK
jgi:molybdopterin-guanine dinucleotide biosynthesis protein A